MKNKKNHERNVLIATVGTRIDENQKTKYKGVLGISNVNGKENIEFPWGSHANLHDERHSYLPNKIG